MMKKGFTLAEVLITLTIIGVVAVLTLPGLMANTAEQQARTALKKMMNTFSQAAEMHGAIAGFNYDGIRGASPAADGAYAAIDDDENGDFDYSMFKMFTDRLSVVRDKGAEIINPSANITALADIAVYLKDGTAIYFKHDDTVDTGNVDTIASDGTMIGFNVLFDTNGSKGPNLISSCSGAEATAYTTDDETSCRAKSNRYIKDVFMMRLRGATVAPIGSMSEWMMDDMEFQARDIDKGSYTGEVEE